MEFIFLWWKREMIIKNNLNGSGMCYGKKWEGVEIIGLCGYFFYGVVEEGYFEEEIFE